LISACIATIFTSTDTLLRVVRRCGKPNLAPPAVIGVDDWAWRRIIDEHAGGSL
jgi:hypothetical protein